MDEDRERRDRVRAAARAGPEALRACWAEIVADIGTDGASRVWQEAFAALDAEQQT
jgi:hypothetical protein